MPTPSAKAALTSNTGHRRSRTVATLPPATPTRASGHLRAGVRGLVLLEKGVGIAYSQHRVFAGTGAVGGSDAPGVNCRRVVWARSKFQVALESIRGWLCPGTGRQRIALCVDIPGLWPDAGDPIQRPPHAVVVGPNPILHNGGGPFTRGKCIGTGRIRAGRG